MDPRLHPYVSLFKSALHRDNILALPARMNRQLLLYLGKVYVSPHLKADHSTAHLQSFAAHVQALIDMPCKKLTYEGHQLYNVMGLLVLEKLPQGSFNALIWQKEPGWTGPDLLSFEPLKTPILNFPSTNLWKTTLKEVLAKEALVRIGDVVRAQAWTDWAWNYIEYTVIKPLKTDELQYANNAPSSAADRGWVNTTSKSSVACSDCRRKESTNCAAPESWTESLSG